MWASQRILKAAMAITDAIITLLIVVHIVGNLKVLIGPHAFSDYATWLRQVAYPFLLHEGLPWAVRLALGACVVTHIAAGIALRQQTRNAREAFRRRALPAHTIGARSILATGVLIRAFVLLHVLDLAIGRLIAPESLQTPTISNSEPQVSTYHSLVVSLLRPDMVLFYSLAILTLSLHLVQNLWDVVIDLSGASPRLREARRALTLDMTLVVAVVNGLLPVLVCTRAIG